MKHIVKNQNIFEAGKWSHHEIVITKRGASGNLTYIFRNILQDGKIDKMSITEYTANDPSLTVEDFTKCIKYGLRLDEDGITEVKKAVKYSLPFIAITSVVDLTQLKASNYGCN